MIANPILLTLKPRQVFNLILPRVNVRRQSAWYKDGEQPDMSPADAQARAPPRHAAAWGARRAAGAVSAGVGPGLGRLGVKRHPGAGRAGADPGRRAGVWHAVQDF